ncbi:hypothetical protein [Solidesulfovibrio sp. C21]|uniref:hypothetical protein n=1 Tax=Solidesulfovibrio sp. C21 TaxID=3398613 RepID=UPI0039FCE870
MEESILREILAVQKEILAELRLMRQALAPQSTKAAGPSLTTPVAATATPVAPGMAAPIPPSEPAPAAPRTEAAPMPPAATPAQPAATAAPQAQVQPPHPSQPTGSMLTLDELTDLGGQFLEPGQMSRGTKVAPVEAADLLRDIKAKNRAKRGAFAEFDKFERGR